MFDPIVSELMPCPKSIGHKRRASKEKPGARSSSKVLSATDRAGARALFCEPTRYVPSALFTRTGAERRLFELAEVVAPADVSWYRPLVEDLSVHTSRDARIRQSTPLTAAQERVLFLQLNYARYRVERLRKRTGRSAPTARSLREAWTWHSRAEAVRAQIAEANVALVLAMARRVRADDMEFADLIGEGNMALMRSIDRFDCERGFKFSTYACRAILKAFSRAGIKSTRYRQRMALSRDPDLDFGTVIAPEPAAPLFSGAPELRELLHRNAASLSHLEQLVIENRFGFTAHHGGVAPTLEEVGGRLGITKERVRQVQNAALAKLRGLLTRRDAGPAVLN